MYKINLSRRGVAAEVCLGISDYMLEKKRELPIRGYLCRGLIFVPVMEGGRSTLRCHLHLELHRDGEGEEEGKEG